jgi:hypothetical protein
MWRPVTIGEETLNEETLNNVVDVKWLLFGPTRSQVPLGLARRLLPIMCVIVLLLASGCGSGMAPEDSIPTKQVEGRVLEVVARNITEIETLRVRDTLGREWSFTTEGWIGFTPSHIREHQLFGQLVLISFVEKEGELIAVDVVDSPG